MLTLTINDLTLSPAPAVDVRLAATDHHGTGATRETWALKGTLTAQSPDALTALRDSLESALNGPVLTLTLSSGDTTLRTLDATGTLLPPHVTELRFDPPDPAKLHPSVTYTAKVEAVRESAWQPPVGPIESKLTFGYSASGLATLTTEVSGRVPPGTSEDDIPALFAIAVPLGMRRTESRITLHANGTASHRATDTEVARALPSGVTDGNVTTTILRGADGRLRRIVEGHFTGPSAANRAREQRPASLPLLAESVTEDPFTRRVDFRFEVLADDAVNISIRGHSESISYTERRRMVELPLLAPSLPPHRQEIGAPAMDVLQRGSATGTGHHPAPAAPLFPDDVIEREVSYSPVSGSAQRPSGNAPRETTWRYLMRPQHALTPQPRP